MSFSPSTIVVKPSLEKRTVVVHVTFLKLGEIDTLKECFDADILIVSRWREPELDKTETEETRKIDSSTQWNPKIFIENTHGDPRVTSSIFVEYVNIGDAFVIERKRFKGTFLENLELFEFPFDVQDLSVNIMSDLPSSEVMLMENPETVHRIYKQSFIDEQEWYLYKYIESEKKEFAKDKVDPSITRSSLLVRCRAARRPAYFIWNIFSVTFLISCLSFVTFAVESGQPHRLTLSFTLILTAVAFKFTVNQSLPRISYLTYLDRYILVNLILLTVVAMWHGVKTSMFKTKRPTLGQTSNSVAGYNGVKSEHVYDAELSSSIDQVDLYAIIVFAVLFILYNIVFIARIVLRPYRKRRLMKRLETNYIYTVQSQSREQPSIGAKFFKLQSLTGKKSPDAAVML